MLMLPETLATARQPGRPLVALVRSGGRGSPNGPDIVKNQTRRGPDEAPRRTNKCGALCCTYSRTVFSIRKRNLLAHRLGLVLLGVNV